MNKLSNDLIQFEMVYEYSSTVYTQKEVEGKHIDISIDNKENIYSAKLVSKVSEKIKLISFKMEFGYNFLEKSKVYLNGYQSWTDSREYNIDEKLNCLSPLGKFASNLLSLNAYGDYGFKKYANVPGVFHGFSYAYIRNDKTYDLFGSLTERQGFTIINFDCNSNLIIIEKDVEGVAFEKEYSILDLFYVSGEENAVFDMYFSAMNIQKPKEKHRCGYTTWYNYYPNINEKIVHDDLEALSSTGEKIDIFQIDDGYQTAVGDWLSIDNKKFPNGMKAVADSIHQKGMMAGIWLAPLGCQKGSKTLKEHPDWFIRDKNGKLVYSGINWGGFYTLDINNKAAADYIRHCFDVILNEWGYDLVKLDFLYGASMIPYNNKSRGQLMCEAMDFLRDCVGDKLILGCGVPLAPAFGKVDFCRIGPDMGLKWKRDFLMKHTHREFVCTEYAITNTIFRRQLDGRAFCNDPDVCLLRDYNIKMDFEQRRLVTKINKIFGNLIFISDNVDKYNEKQMEVFKETFRDTDIERISAEYIDTDIVKVVYKENGEQKEITFNIGTGKEIK
ncbi:MAG: alpha-galactosidase [Clostridiales bacterium]|nr:alpha-galactosidase [Clostridiales bacterium]